MLYNTRYAIIYDTCYVTQHMIMSCYITHMIMLYNTWYVCLITHVML